MLMSLFNITDLLVEHWHFVQSPYHTFEAHDIARVEIRHCAVDNREDSTDRHDKRPFLIFIGNPVQI